MRKILLATAAGFAALVANGATPAPAYAQAAQVTGQTPQPGLSLTVSGRFRFHGAWVDQSGDSANVATLNHQDGDKLAKYDFNTYGRLRFDLSGRNEAGLIYGGRLEARMAATGGGSPTMFFRRVTGFVGTPTLGQLRFGSGNVMAVEQMHVGHIMGSIATGLLDGDASDFFYTGGGFLAANNFWYSSSVVNRSTAIGYYSPQFAGFDIGLSFAPSEKGFLGDCGDAAMRNCDRIERVGGGGTNANQVRNIVDAMLRYRGTFGGVGVAASFGGRMASTADATNGATAFKNPWGLIGGAEVTFAGFTVGGLMHGGRYQRSFAPLQDTAAGGTKDSAFGWQIGARYTFGAFTVGAAYHELKTEGDQGNPADLRERGFGLGGSYSLGPGLALFAEYLYSRVRESGRDFFNYQVGTQDKMTANVVLVGVGIGF
ncbi:porin [Elioraea thermophila]|uniref:porin n=1 Tax=Elioraea thermophila TaxID=2185104 RepID=UPI00130096CB|nr:porin [Elioraea thermophila]